MKKTLLLLWVISSHVFSQVPHLKGVVKIDRSQGTVDGSWEVSNYPKIKNYAVRINVGFNIEAFSTLDGKDFYYANRYCDDGSSEAFSYYFPNSDNTGRFLPKNGFRVSYVGKFPVVSDTNRAADWGDWKGNIAFNKNSLRMSEQSAWYPILYDADTKEVFDKVTYEIELINQETESLFLQGNQPIKAKTIHLKSETPQLLMLYIGKYDFSQLDNITYINTELNTDDQHLLKTKIKKTTDFYEAFLGINYGQNLSLIATNPTSKKNAWMFVTFPAIVFVANGSYQLKEVLKSKDNKTFDMYMGSINHELAHYYFGTRLVPSSTLSWVFLEGFTEYLSLLAVRETIGQSNYQKKIKEYFKYIKGETFIPLANIQNRAEVDETYRYSYAPLLLTAIEKEIGLEKTQKWLKLLLQNQNSTQTDYALFVSSLGAVIKDDAKLKEIESKYLNNEKSVENISKTINSDN